jgi:hypothetical protein
MIRSTARAPRRNLLDEPCIAVGIGEGEERPIARVRGIGARKTCLRGEWRAVPHVTRTDATAGDFLMCRSDVGDNQSSYGRTRRRRSNSVAEINRATRARRRELDDANVLCRGDILVKPPTQLLIELLGALDIRHGDDVNLEVHGNFNFRYTGVRFLLIHMIYLLAKDVYWLRLPNETP